MVKGVHPSLQLSTPALWTSGPAACRGQLTAAGAAAAVNVSSAGWERGCSSLADNPAYLLCAQAAAGPPLGPAAEQQPGKARPQC